MASNEEEIAALAVAIAAGGAGRDSMMLMEAYVTTSKLMLTGN